MRINVRLHKDNTIILFDLIGDPGSIFVAIAVFIKVKSLSKRG